jgi:DNA polymerase-3 subunit gamma/tau
VKKSTPGGSSVKLTSLDNLKKELLEKPKEEDSNKKNEEVIYEEIDHYAFQQVWKSYVQKLLDEKKQVVFQILEAFPPELTDKKTITINVGTESYLNSLNEERESMYYFLKKELDKKAIDLVIRVDRQKQKQESTRKPYTAGEKFNYMVQKNAKLKDLKDRLKLELDY